MGAGVNNCAQADTTPVPTTSSTNTITAQTPTLGDDSAYTLTKVDTKGENTVTKFEYDEVSQTITPVYYSVDLKQTTYGEGDTARGFVWNDSNHFEYTNSESPDIVLKCDSTRPLASPITYYNYSDLNGVDNEDFLGFWADTHWGETSGGAIYSHSSTIGNLTADFIDNSAMGDIAYGGAIMNAYGSIGDINGNFYFNLVESTSRSDYGEGGAIYNIQGTIGNINGHFIGNTVYGNEAYGGAILNGEGTLGNITGNFIDNYVKSSNGDAYGGAIDNDGEIGDIAGAFIGNSSTSELGYAYGGAIYNSGTIGSKDNDGNIVGGIKGDFIGNYATSDHMASGGAVYNDGQIGDITGDFIGNYAKSEDSTYGGAIENYVGIIGNITGNFTGNYVESVSRQSCGGAIANRSFNNAAVIGNISGNFTNNHVKNSGDLMAYGGAISNAGNSGTANIGDIHGNFIQNYAQSANGNAASGAINNSIATINSISGYFEGNYALSGGRASGGAITNTGKSVITEGITANFKDNYAKSTGTGALARGGAVLNFGYITDLTGDFDGNYAESSGTGAIGGALGNIFSNATYSFGIDKISGNYTNNKAIATGSGYAYGGAIYNTSTLGDIKGNFVGNSAEGLFASGGALHNEGSIGVVSGTFEDNKAVSDYVTVGGAIYNGPDPLPGFVILGEEGNSAGETEQSALLKLENVTFKNNYAKAEYGMAYGGALYTAYDLRLEAKDGYTSLISGNYVEDEDGKRSEAIYAVGSTLELNANTNASIVVDDIIVLNESDLKLTGDATGKIVLNNEVQPIYREEKVSLSDVTLYLGTRDNVLDGNNLTLNSGQISMINNQVGVSALNSLTVTGDTNVAVDVDLKNKTMDRFTASEYGSHSGNLNVAGMNLLSDAVSDNTEIYFAEQGLKDNVTYGGGELPNSNYQTTLYTPIYKYNVTYDNREDAGYFMFTRPSSGASDGGSNPPVENFNPAVLGSTTSATVGAVGTMNQTFNYAFQNSADFMNIPYLERISMKNANKYALSVTGDATDMGNFSPLFTKQENASVWVKPYATFENVPLKNGPKVSNITYGTIVGFDSEMQHLKRGWDRVFTGYIGYNGASQRYSGVDSTQNGGVIGGTVTMYKGNFFNATTLSVGASVAENTNMYGKEDFTMLLSGIGNKTGYNFEFKEGKLILQPSMLMSYTFVNTFDYTNSAGVRIDNKPLHAIQLAPGVKVIGNLKHGWQPYASVSMVWNLMGESDARANGVKLPEMSIKPYVQYGVGVQKQIKDHFMAYGQAMIQNGGRNGISLTGGFRWALGHECKMDKVQKNKPTLTQGTNNTKKVLKQLSRTNFKAKVQISEIN